MPKSISPGDLSKAIQEQLTIYHKDVTERIDAEGRKAIKKLVKLTQETAPIGDRLGGNFATSITSQEIKGPRGSTFVWGVKSPNHRLTHLLVHGHDTVNGKRTKANPFLEKALDTVLPEYEAAVEEALKND